MNGLPLCRKQFAMTAYGLRVPQNSEQEAAKAGALREDLLSHDGFRFRFGYLAAYNDQTQKQSVTTV